jgi:hypothetical protein
VSIELREVQAPDNTRGNWQQMKTIFEPVTANLPRKEDKDYFQGFLSFNIGKEPRLSNIPRHLMFIYQKKEHLISLFYFYRRILDMDWIRRNELDFLADLGLFVSEEGLLIKYGIGGFQRQYVEQKVEQTTVQPKKKGWLG